MRRVEEKTLMIIEAISLLFIVFASICYEISNNIIEDHASQISYRAHIINGVGIQWLQIAEERSRFEFLRANKLEMVDMEALNGDNSPYSAINLELRNGAINKLQYLEKRADILHKKTNDLATKYDLNVKLLNKLHADKDIPKWKNAQSVINIIRILAIAISIFLYLWIFSCISKRIVKSKE